MGYFFLGRPRGGAPKEHRDANAATALENCKASFDRLACKWAWIRGTPVSLAKARWLSGAGYGRALRQQLLPIAAKLFARRQGIFGFRAVFGDDADNHVLAVIT